MEINNFKSVNIDQNKESDESPDYLYLATKNNNKNLCASLMKSDFNPNYQSESDTTLISAIANQNLALVQKLLESGADANLYGKDKTLSPIMAAMFSEQPEIAKLLVSHHVHLLSTTKSGLSSAFFLEVIKPSLKQESYQEFKEILSGKNDIITSKRADRLQQKYEEEKFRKLAGMIYEFDGKSPFFNKVKQTYLPPLFLEGLPLGSYWVYNEIAQSLESFRETPEGSLLKEFATELIRVFNDGAENLYSSKQLEMIQQGETCLINTGFKGHSVSILFMKGKMCICNRGAMTLGSPITILDINNKLMSEEVLKKISQQLLLSKKEYSQFILDELPKFLDAESSIENMKIQQLCHLKLQHVGNCTWASAATALYAMLILMINEKSDLPETNKTAYMAYYKWLTFYQTDLLEKYLNHHISLGDKGTFSPDYDLINGMFNRLWSYQKSQWMKNEEVEALENLYLKILPKDMHEAFINQKKVF